MPTSKHKLEAVKDTTVIWLSHETINNARKKSKALHQVISKVTKTRTDCDFKIFLTYN
jgi:hypothetical protein